MKFCYFLAAFAFLAHTAPLGSPAECPSQRRLQYKTYALMPICSKLLTMRADTNPTCVMAAAVSPVQAAAVMSKTDSVCYAVAALCARYELCLSDCPYSVLIPASLLTTLEHLVLSIKSGCGVRVWDLLTVAQWSNSSYVVQPASPDVTALPSHFRSSLLDDTNVQRLISGLTYKQMIVQLYKSSSVVVRVVFDVSTQSGSLTSLNWFRKERVVECFPVASLSSMTTNYFSIEGDTNSPSQRRFFINMNYGGCDVDRGLMSVLDSNDDACTMYRYSQPVPRIVYSPDPTKPMHLTIQNADYLAILVR